MLSVGYVVAMASGYHCIAPKLRPIASQYHFITPGDWIRYRFASEPMALTLLRILAFILSLALLNILFAQLKAMGEMAEVMTGGMIPYNAGILLLALIVLVYDLAGGLRAVAWTDTLQGLIMLSGLILLVVWLIEQNNSLHELTASIAQIKPDNLAEPTYEQNRFWLSTMVLVGFSTIIYPQALQRLFAAKSDVTLYRSLSILGFLLFLAKLVVFFVGLSAIVLFPVQDFKSDQILLLVLRHWAEGSSIQTVGAIMILLAILAAIMSTADSVLLRLVSLLMRDTRKHQPKQNSMKTDRRLACLIMTILALGALYRDISFWRLLEIKLELLLQCMPAFVIALHWRKLTASAVLSGLIAGIVFYVLSLTYGVPYWYGVHAGVVALGCNIVVLTAVYRLQIHRKGLGVVDEKVMTDPEL